MSRRPAHHRLTWLPALLAAMATSWAAADEPFPFPAPPLRSKPVYLAPDPLPALPAPKSQPSASAPQARSVRPAAIRKVQAIEEANPAQRGGLVPPVRKSVVADTTETDRRVDRLKRQLEELNELLSRPPVEPPVIERPIVSPLEPTPFQPERPLATEPSPVPPPVVPEQSHQGTPHAEPPQKSTPPENSKSPSAGLIKGLPTSAIDRVYVADNLFAAAEYALANDIYLQVDRRSISGDESGWVEFQLANCSRRLGRIDEAKKRYRRVVADPTLGWLQDLAKWRLDAIDEAEQLVKEHARLDAAIKQFTEAPRAPAKQ